MSDENAPKAWHRIKGESKKAHAAFMDYCEMGPGRSLRKLHDRYVKQAAIAGQTDPESNLVIEEPPTEYESTIFTWSARHKWQDRLSAWEEEQERIKRLEHKKAIIRAADRHAKHSQMIQIALMQPVAELLRRWEDDPEIIKKVSIDDLVFITRKAGQILPNVQKAERLALGLPTEIHELQDMTDEELLEYYRDVVAQVTGTGEDRAGDGTPGDQDTEADDGD